MQLFLLLMLWVYTVYIKLLKINKNQLIKRWVGYIEVEKTACLFAFPECCMKNADQVMDVFGTLRYL